MMNASLRINVDPSSLFESLIADDVGFFGDVDDISSANLEYEDRRAKLQELIDRMVTAAPSWDGEPLQVSNEAAATAIRFLRVLPSNRELPKVAPDGDGDVILIWEPPHGNCIVTVQDNCLHVVDQPGSKHVKHIDAEPFRSARIPISVLHVLPMK